MTRSQRFGKRRLVVGGGRAADFPRLRDEDVAFNIDVDALPDVLGSINQAPFRSQVFAEVYFERVPFGSFTGRNITALWEAIHLLEPEGRLVIETGIFGTSCGDTSRNA